MCVTALPPIIVISFHHHVFGAPENTEHRSICDQFCVEQCALTFVLVLDNIFVFVYFYFEICRAHPKLECAQAKLAELLSQSCLE